MTHQRQKAAVGAGQDRQAAEIARSFARLAPLEDRRPWLGPASLTAAVGLSIAGAAFLMTGESPFSHSDTPAAPEIHADLGAEGETVDGAMLPDGDAPREVAAVSGVRLPQFAPRRAPDTAEPADLAAPAAGGPSDPQAEATRPVAASVRSGSPALLPQPRSGIRVIAAASAPMRPRPRPADPTGIRLTRAAPADDLLRQTAAAGTGLRMLAAPQDELAASLRPRLRPGDLVARAPSAMASLADTGIVAPRAPALRGAGCAARLAAGMPDRPRRAASGSALARRMDGVHGSDRDALIERELLSGNLPGFLRNLTPVTIAGRLPGGRRGEVTICVTPDYLALGSDADYLRVPMGLPAAARIADRFGFLLPTTRMVDAIFAQARLRLAPQPMTPGAEMSSTRYFQQHNSTVQGQTRGRAGLLTAGQKKDLVLTNRLRQAPGRVAIYGWHKPDGQPIQPLSTVHGARYADYSHGVRLVSRTAFVNGRAVPLADLLSDPAYARILTGEGPIEAPARLMVSLYR